MDEDHLDIYQNHDDIKTTFTSFAQKLSIDGVLIHNSKLDPFYNIPGKHIFSGIDNPISIATAMAAKVFSIL